VALIFAAILALSIPDPARAQPFESRFVEGGGVRLHYLDFGGEGLPIVFVHSESWDAHTYEAFGPRLTEAGRVLAVTRPGYGASEAHTGGFDVTAQAESLIDFLDALGIERAVFAGNSSPTTHLTYLAEHHPDRVAGVIYLAGLLTPWLWEVTESDPTGAGVMASRARAPDATSRKRQEALMSYRPEFLAGDTSPIGVPALAFAGRSGTIGHERFSEPLALAGSALMADFFAELSPSPFRDYFQRLIGDHDFRTESLQAVMDPAAREFLLRLAVDAELQARVWSYQVETVAPAVLAGQRHFYEAFGRLHLVRLDEPVVYGYEYRDAPELIEPYIRGFLEEVGAREQLRSDRVDVAPPTGEKEADRAGILAAIEKVRPGGTVQFAAGTYLVGNGIQVTTPRITLLGHADGTTLRGCAPEEISDLRSLAGNCNGLELLGGHQTVRGLTFEYAYTGVYLGGCMREREAFRNEGGDVVEGNTFRTGYGVLVESAWTEPAVIRANRFINTFHAVGINGSAVHVLDNDFSVPEPEQVLIAGFPSEAIYISPSRHTEGGPPPTCTGNVVAGNRISGTPMGIELNVWEANTSCHGNVIRDNRIAVAPARVPEWSPITAQDDSRIVYGVPIALNDYAAEPAGADGDDGVASPIYGNVVEGNRIIGGPGPAIQLQGASGNRIIHNTISGTGLRGTYPGDTFSRPPPGPDANGAGIWISRGSDENEVVGNVFEDVAGHTMVIEGDRNRVEMRAASNIVHDLGSGNQVTVVADLLRQGRGPIIDMHLHAGPGSEASTIYTLRPGETPDDARFRTALEEMDRHGVVLAVVSGTAAYADRYRATDPGRFIAGLSFPCTAGMDPHLDPCFASGDDWPDLAWLRAEIEAGRIGAFGELYNVYAGVSPTDPRMEPYWALAAEFDLPVAVHSDRGPPPAGRVEGCCPAFNEDFASPALYRSILERHPDLRLYLMHILRHDAVQEAIGLMDDFPNVYADTSPMSLVPQFAVHNALQRMIEAGHADRIVFGSDYLGAIGHSIAVIEAAELLTNEQKRAIYYGNAARLLGLAEELIARHREASNHSGR
jgi:uncharacterized protein